MIIWLLRMLAFLFLLVGGYLLIHSVYTSLRWVVQVSQLAEEPNISQKQGLRIGVGLLLLSIAFIFWYPEFWSVLPCGILIAVLGGGLAALNMHIRQKNARRMLGQEIKKGNQNS